MRTEQTEPSPRSLDAAGAMVDGLRGDLMRTFHVGIRRISTGEIFLAANNFGDEKN